MPETLAEWTLQFDAPWRGAVVLGCVVLTLALGWIGRPRGGRALEVALVALAGAVLAGLASGPVAERSGQVSVPARTAILVDDSASMGVIEGGGRRSDAVAAVLAALDGPTADTYRVGERFAVGAPTSFEGLGTDLALGIEGLVDRLGSERLASLVVITDGQDRGPLRTAIESGSLGPELPGPLTVVLVGREGQVRDLAVTGVKVGGYGFVRTPLDIVATLRGTGLGASEVPVTLLRDGAVVATQRAVLDGDGGATVTFTVRPTEAGRATYEVTVPHFDGDAIPSNDRLPVVVRVVQDTLRVLQVAGSPSWDVKFLRRFLKGDPSVDLVCFFILRTPEDDLRAWSADELSLIEFPYERLFADELGTFDVVVLQNFDPEPYFREGTEALLGNLADWVRDGGALVLVGGDRSFGLAGLGATPLADVLPVALPGPEVAPWEAPFRPRLTPEGQRHPVTRLVSDPLENDAWWERLPPLDGMNAVGARVPGATVLLAHPEHPVSGEVGAPVLAVREVGRGRTMALAVDSSWRWSVTEAAAGRGNQAYLRLWKNALRWLHRDPTMSRVGIETSADNLVVGAPLRVVVTARDGGFEALPGAVITLTERGPDGVVTTEGRTDEDGQALFEPATEVAGTRDFTAEVTEDGQSIGSAQAMVAVSQRAPELDLVDPDRALMERWVAARGGRVVTPEALGEPLRDDNAGRTESVRQTVRLDEHLGWSLALGTVFAAAALVRRRQGGR